MLDREYVKKRMSERFICPICGETDTLDNAYIEARPTGGNTTSSPNGLMGLGGTKYTTTTYYGYFRFCKKCGKIRNRARKNGRIIYIFMLIIFVAAIALYIYNNDHNGHTMALITALFSPIVTIPFFLIFYDPIHNFLCYFSKNIRKTPDFWNNANYYRAYQGNAIGKKYMPWDFPDFIPQPIVGLDYENNFICPICKKETSISESKTYNCKVGNNIYYNCNAEIDEKHFSNVRLCKECYNNMLKKIKVTKIILLTIITIFSAIVFIYSICTNSSVSIIGLAFGLSLSCLILYLLIRDLIVKFVIKLSKYNPSQKDYVILKNTNAIDQCRLL